MKRIIARVIGGFIVAFLASNIVTLVVGSNQLAGVVFLGFWVLAIVAAFRSSRGGKIGFDSLLALAISLEILRIRQYDSALATKYSDALLSKAPNQGGGLLVASDPHQFFLVNEHLQLLP